MLPQLLPIDRSFGGSHITRFLDKTRDLAVGHVMRIDLKAIKAHAMRELLVFAASRLIAAHGGLAAGNPDHPGRLLGRHAVKGERDSEYKIKVHYNRNRSSPVPKLDESYN